MAVVHPHVGRLAIRAVAASSSLQGIRKNGSPAFLVGLQAPDMACRRGYSSDTLSLDVLPAFDRRRS